MTHSVLINLWPENCYTEKKLNKLTWPNLQLNNYVGKMFKVHRFNPLRHRPGISHTYVYGKLSRDYIPLCLQL